MRRMLARPPGFRSWAQAGGYLVAGCVVSIGIAWVLALTMTLDFGRTTQAEGAAGDGYWMITRIDRVGATLIRSTRSTAKRSWGPEQATGEPDTPHAGDQSTAWATATSDMGEQWLHLFYAEPIAPVAVVVHENCSPGALIRITTVRGEGSGENEFTLWKGADPTTPPAASGVSRVEVSTPDKVREIRIYLDTSKVAGWNEVDAVGIEDRAGRTHWAVAARASSIYGVTTDASRYAQSILPRWAPDESARPPSRPTLAPVPLNDDPENRPPNLKLVVRSVSPASARSGEKLHAGFGFPMLALASHWDPSAPPTAIPAVSAYSSTGSPTATKTPVLPYDPIVLGLAVDALVWAIVLRLLVLAVTKPVRMFGEVLRLRRGACLRCGYDLQYDFVNGCPECGWRRGNR